MVTQAIASTTSATPTADTDSVTAHVPPSVAWETRIQIVRRHFEAKGYRVHSGLQFGCELVLYADDPSRVHSDFCIHVVPEGTFVHGVCHLKQQYVRGCFYWNVHYVTM
jgi:hypothetical protein